jgi:hypothetical protein
MDQDDRLAGARIVVFKVGCLHGLKRMGRLAAIGYRGVAGFINASNSLRTAAFSSVSGAAASATLTAIGESR